jgi:hypothetical protein
LTTSNPGDGVKVDIDKILDENIRANPANRDYHCES